VVEEVVAVVVEAAAAVEADLHSTGVSTIPTTDSRAMMAQMHSTRMETHYACRYAFPIGKLCCIRSCNH
jgi:hypothetical protein